MKLLTISIFVTLFLTSFICPMSNANNTPNSTKNMLQGIKSYTKILFSINDFNFKDTGDVPYYIHKNKNALAINAGKKDYRNKFAHATYSYTEKTANFALTLVTLAEIDGESKYQIKVNDKLIGEFQNDETSIDYQENYFTVTEITLKKGDVITVSSMAVTNGKIPEHNETAYARGRWRALVFTNNDNQITK